MGEHRALRLVASGSAVASLSRRRPTGRCRRSHKRGVGDEKSRCGLAPAKQPNILWSTRSPARPPRRTRGTDFPLGRPRAMIEPCPAIGTSKSGEHMRHVPAKGPLACPTMRRNACSLPSLLHTTSSRSERKCLPRHLGSDDKKPVHGSQKEVPGLSIPHPDPTAERRSARAPAPSAPDRAADGRADGTTRSTSRRARRASSTSACPSSRCTMRRAAADSPPTCSERVGGWGRLVCSLVAAEPPS